MRLTVKAFLAAIVILTISHIVAVTTESQVAAQTSWILIWVVIGVAVVMLGDLVYQWSRQSTGQ